MYSLIVAMKTTWRKLISYEKLFFYFNALIVVGQGRQTGFSCFIYGILMNETSGIFSTKSQKKCSSFSKPAIKAPVPAATAKVRRFLISYDMHKPKVEGRLSERNRVLYLLIS
ncbi:CLUMA_CG017786, isoform A [Clunio marinus]|uniref:CLUMA_CG017786, isoform A n=1 Tax=Clunio marinus TaxID=568069 RepID=A0A1J1IZX6_9DIPT|nr:CLUMA_CG017786, isoform A [Clunio marinus]